MRKFNLYKEKLVHCRKEKNNWIIYNYGVGLEDFASVAIPIFNCKKYYYLKECYQLGLTRWKTEKLAVRNSFNEILNGNSNTHSTFGTWNWNLIWRELILFSNFFRLIDYFLSSSWKFNHLLFLSFNEEKNGQLKNRCFAVPLKKLQVCGREWGKMWFYSWFVDNARRPGW